MRASPVSSFVHIQLLECKKVDLFAFTSDCLMKISSQSSEQILLSLPFVLAIKSCTFIKASEKFIGQSDQDWFLIELNCLMYWTNSKPGLTPWPLTSPWFELKSSGLYPENSCSWLLRPLGYTSIARNICYIK